MTPVFYMAHPVAGDVPGNLARAKRWLAWLYHELGGIVVVAPWIHDLEALPLRDDRPDDRKVSLLRNLDVIDRCDGVILVGGVISEGMRIEANHAVVCRKQVISHISLGAEPPERRSQP